MGHYRDAKALMDEVNAKKMFSESKFFRMLTDFTGDSYRLIMEEGYDSQAEYEKALTSGMGHADFQSWYTRFKEQAVSSRREILKVVG